MSFFKKKMSVFSQRHKEHNAALLCIENEHNLARNRSEQTNTYTVVRINKDMHAHNYAQ